MAKLVVFDADKERHLKCGFNQMSQLEEELGRPLSEIREGFRLKDMITMFHVFLKWQDKELTHDKVGDIMDEAVEKNGMNYLDKKLEEVMSKFGESSAVPTDK